MKKSILALFLSALLLLPAGCGAAEGGSRESQAAESSGEASEAEKQTAEPFQALENKTIGALDGYTLEMMGYTYFYSYYKDNLEYQALSNGFTEENLSDFWNLNQGDELIKDLLAREALLSAKQQAVLYKNAADAGTKPNEEENKLSDERIDQMLELEGGDEQAFLNKYFMTPAQMKEIYYKLNLVSQYQQDLMDGVEVTDEVLREAFEENRDSFEKVTVRHVLINSDDSMTEEERAEARTKAEDILKRINEGEDIGKLAAEFSDDGGSKDKDGEYTFGKGEMVSEFEAWSFSADPGDTAIVDTVFGHHVMQMIAKLGLEDVRDEVEEYVRYQKASESLEYIDDLVETGEWNLDQDALNQLSVG